MIKKKHSDYLNELKLSHSSEAIKERLENGPDNSYLKDFIYGSIDGTITTFAVVSGVVGAELSNVVIIILGFANLAADGFSMGVSNYLGTRADIEQFEKAKKQEYEHIDVIPEGEKEEIRQIFAQKGFEGNVLEKIVDVITSDKKRWVETMLTEEHGFSLNTPSPLKAGLTTFISFFLIGLIPLISYVINWISPESLDNPYQISLILTGLAFFIVGAIKSKFIITKWYMSGLSTLFIGGLAASIAYYVGKILKNLIL